MTKEELSHLEKGDLLEIEWFDILIDETGDPTKSRLLRRRQYGLFLEVKTDSLSGIEILVTASGIDIDEDAVPQSGWQATPVALIKRVKRIKKGKKDVRPAKADPLREVPR